MRLRIVQDHDSEAQPWYRLEQHVANIDQWHMIASGQNLEKLREMMGRVIESNGTEAKITVIVESGT